MFMHVICYNWLFWNLNDYRLRVRFHVIELHVLRKISSLIKVLWFLLKILAVIMNLVFLFLVLPPVSIKTRAKQHRLWEQGWKKWRNWLNHSLSKALDQLMNLGDRKIMRRFKVASISLQIRGKYALNIDVLQGHLVHLVLC